MSGKKVNFELAQLLMENIASFKKAHGLRRMVMTWCASTEIYLSSQEVHRDIDNLARAMKYQNRGY